jgi:hypothetical protein
MGGVNDMGKENAMMVSKVLTATLVASLGVPVAAVAAQESGRGSVYASPATAVRTAPLAAVGARAGRDSVYATSPVGPTPHHSTAGHTSVRYGRT